MKQRKHSPSPAWFFSNTCNCNSIWNQQLFWALNAGHQIVGSRNTFPSDLQPSDTRVIKNYSEFNIHISPGAVWEHIIPTRTQNIHVKDDWMDEKDFLSSKAQQDRAWSASDLLVRDTMTKKNPKKPHTKNPTKRKQANVISYLEILCQDWKSWVPIDKKGGWEGSEPQPLLGTTTSLRATTPAWKLRMS